MKIPSVSVIHTLILITLLLPGYNATSSQKRPHSVVVRYLSGPQKDLTCQKNATKGIYSFYPNGKLDPDKCCQGKLLVDPFWMPLVTKKPTIESIPPSWILCDYNVTRDNDNLDLPSLMWNIYACKVKSLLGKSESEINYASYVNMRTNHSTDEIRKLIEDENKECPEAEKETVFPLKIAAYFSCFEKHGKKVCQATTPESEKKLQIYLKHIKNIYNSTKAKPCPGVLEGSSHYEQCCKGVPVPHSWSRWLVRTVEQQSFFQDLPNGTRIIDKTYQDCMITNYNTLSNKTASSIPIVTTKLQKLIYYAFHDACFLNPVKFLDDGTQEPKEIKFDFDQALGKYLSNFNSAMRDTISQFAMKLKKRATVQILNVKKEKVIIKLSDAGTTYNNMTSPLEKARLYIGYYKLVAAVGKRSLVSLCM